MAEDFDNHRRIFDGGDDLQGAAERAISPRAEAAIGRRKAAALAK
jgi:hypothetical protein